MPADNTEAQTAHSVADLIAPVRQKLNAFNPGFEYDQYQLIFAIGQTVKSGRIQGVSLLPDRRTFNCAVAGTNRTLLINYACKVFVDRVYSVASEYKKRIPRHQQDFASELENEIYQIENGEGIFDGR